MTTRDCDLYVVLALTHQLPVELSPYQDFLQWMTGERLAPIQMGRARDVCAPILVEQYPALATVPPIPDFGDDTAAMDAWCDQQRA
ncbi:hypothetical protein [Thermomonospora umbrina]|uniref:DUF7736 domain-containing protein n=1 Tax=Thermomonospora umbrina TaxID=111806 RepID=A0A3D9SWG3_9ACTN|nr:hypothetical protein [Thermomonospora umbrina]REF00290.1 hypothetical protein DFJ69_5820 [Thermomonospora umbrina]